MAGYKSFGPATSDGIPIKAGQKLALRVTHGDGGSRTLERVRFGIHQLEPSGATLQPPGGGPAGPGPWFPHVPVYNHDAGEWLLAVGASGLVGRIPASGWGPVTIPTLPWFDPEPGEWLLAVGGGGGLVGRIPSEG